MRRTTLLTTGDVAEHCQVSGETVKNWIRKGILKAYTTPGQHYRIQKDDLREFLEHCGMPPLEEAHSQKRRVLVVDDDAKLVDIITRSLQKTASEYEIASAADGYEAGLMMAKFCPDLVLLDIIMPYRDGFSVCQKIKANPDTNHIPVLIITGHPEDDNIQRALECGADDYLLKPFEMEDLKRKMDELFRKRTKRTYRGAI